MYQYYYKYSLEENAYYIYLDEKCTIFVGRFVPTTIQSSFLYDLDNIIFIYKGEL